MRYTICTNFPSVGGNGSGARPHANDMIEVIKLRFGLDIDQGPYPGGDGTTKFCYITEDASQAMSLLRMLNEKGIDSYWYDDDPEQKKGGVVHFGSKNRWDKIEKVS